MFIVIHDKHHTWVEESDNIVTTELKAGILPLQRHCFKLLLRKCTMPYTRPGYLTVPPTFDVQPATYYLLQADHCRSGRLCYTRKLGMVDGRSNDLPGLLDMQEWWILLLLVMLCSMCSVY